MSQVLNQVTPMVLTYNESPNIRRVLAALSWAKKVVIIDSFSTDDTISIINTFPNAEVHYRKFDSFASQCNYGLSLIDTEWVLSMDADYVLPADFTATMALTLDNPRYDGYYAPFQFCVFGKPLRGDNTTPRQVLYRKDKANYIDIGHQHRVVVAGESGNLNSYILHDDRKPLSRWLQSQDRYLKIEAAELSTKSYAEVDMADKLRKTKILGPIVVFFYCLFFKGLILQGWHGWHYTLQRTLVESLLAIRLIEAERLANGRS